MKRSIHTTYAPAAIGPYSQAIQAANTVYFSGQIAIDPHTQSLVSEDIKAQVQMVFNHLKVLSEAAGGSLEALVKLTIYLTDLAHFPIVNEVMRSFFKEPYPARATVQVSALPKAALIEVDAVMVLDSVSK
jgi:reactive intermediate/imine deaminase